METQELVPTVPGFGSRADSSRPRPRIAQDTSPGPQGFLEIVSCGTSASTSTQKSQRPARPTSTQPAPATDQGCGRSGLITQISWGRLTARRSISMPMPFASSLMRWEGLLKSDRESSPLTIRAMPRPLGWSSSTGAASGARTCSCSPSRMHTVANQQQGV